MIMQQTASKCEQSDTTNDDELCKSHRHDDPKRNIAPSEASRGDDGQSKQTRNEPSKESSEQEYEYDDADDAEQSNELDGEDSLDRRRFVGGDEKLSNLGEKWRKLASQLTPSKQRRRRRRNRLPSSARVTTNGYSHEQLAPNEPDTTSSLRSKLNTLGLAVGSNQQPKQAFRLPQSVALVVQKLRHINGGPKSSSSQHSSVSAGQSDRHHLEAGGGEAMASKMTPSTLVDWRDTNRNNMAAIEQSIASHSLGPWPQPNLINALNTNWLSHNHNRAPELFGSWAASEGSAIATSARGQHELGVQRDLGRMIPVEIIGLDPSVSSSIFYKHQQTNSLLNDDQAVMAQQQQQLRQLLQKPARPNKKIVHVHHFHMQPASKVEPDPGVRAASNGQADENKTRPSGGNEVGETGGEQTSGDQQAQLANKDAEFPAQSDPSSEPGDSQQLIMVSYKPTHKLVDEVPNSSEDNSEQRHPNGYLRSASGAIVASSGDYQAYPGRMRPASNYSGQYNRLASIFANEPASSDQEMSLAKLQLKNQVPSSQLQVQLTDPNTSLLSLSDMAAEYDGQTSGIAESSSSLGKHQNGYNGAELAQVVGESDLLGKIMAELQNVTLRDVQLAKMHQSQQRANQVNPLRLFDTQNNNATSAKSADNEQLKILAIIKSLGSSGNANVTDIATSIVRNLNDKSSASGISINRLNGVELSEHTKQQLSSLVKSTSNSNKQQTSNEGNNNNVHAKHNANSQSARANNNANMMQNNANGHKLKPESHLNSRHQASSAASNANLAHEYSDSDETSAATSGLSSVAVAFILVVSLVTLTILAASLIYRYKRRAASSSASLSDLTPGANRSNRPKLTQRTRHFLRSNFVSRDHGTIRTMASQLDQASTAGSSGTFKSNTFIQANQSGLINSNVRKANVDNRNELAKPAEFTHAKLACAGESNEQVPNSVVDKHDCGANLWSKGPANLLSTFMTKPNEPKAAAETGDHEQIKTINTRIHRLPVAAGALTASASKEWNQSRQPVKLNSAQAKSNFSFRGHNSGEQLPENVVRLKGQKVSGYLGKTTDGQMRAMHSVDGECKTCSGHQKCLNSSCRHK